MGNETIISLDLPETELKALESMQDKNQTLGEVVQEIIQWKLSIPNGATPFIMAEADLEKLSEQAVKNNTTTEFYLHNLIEQQDNQSTLSKDQLAVATLELVWSQLNDHDENMSDFRRELAGDLLVARMGLEAAQKGKVDPEHVKAWVEELYT